ncbi:MAG: hypothetical protein GC137_05895 [Alphaproteobacteria bacterium]|nr:hypothetical protein [Alphaproteobacteria bacterium]
MTRIPGASQFLNQSRLAAQTGSTFQQTNVLNEAFGSRGILEVGRRIRRTNIGISNDSRNRIRQLLESNKSTANTLFSFAGGGSATQENALTQIKALISSTPTSRKTPAARQVALATQEQLEALADQESQGSSGISPSTIGTILDQQA